MGVYEDEQREIEAYCFKSWDQMEYSSTKACEFGWTWVSPHMPTLIKLLREQGCDKALRASGDGFDLHVTRSYPRVPANHLRMVFDLRNTKNTPEITITFSAPFVEVRWFLDTIRLSQEIEHLLMIMTLYPLDAPVDVLDLQND